MVTVDCWKASREEETIVEFADILAANLMKDAREMEDDDGTVPTCITKSTDSVTTPS